MATLSRRKTKQLQYGVYVLKRTDSAKQYQYVKKGNANGVSFGNLNNALRFARQKDAKNFMKASFLKGLKPVKVYGTKKAWNSTVIMPESL